MANYPLLFTYKDRLLVADKFVEVTTRGRILAFQDPEDRQWWFYGVNPGAIAASGSLPAAAHADFRVTFKDVLADFASEAKKVEVFKAMAEAFFDQVAPETDKEWWDAVQDVRSGRITLPLERRAADEPRGIEVQVVASPNSSEFTTEPALEAAA